MKKVLLSLCMVIMLSGCGGSKEESVETILPTETSETIIEAKEGKEPIMNELISEQELDELIYNSLAEIGISQKDILSKEFTEIKEENGSADVYLDCIISTEYMTLKIPCHYMSLISKWSLTFIENADNHHVYYTPQHLEGLSDLYEYPSDNLISTQSKTYAEASEEAESMQIEAEENLDAALESLADEYGINRH